MSQENGSPEAVLRGCRVLIVEDEPLLAFEMVDEFERLGAIPVGPVVSVDEALSYLAEARELPHGALINVFLRGRASLPVANALTELGVPFLFVTGNDAFVHEHFPDVPCHPKPADLPKLIKALAQLLEEKSGIR